MSRSATLGLLSISFCIALALIHYARQEPLPEEAAIPAAEPVVEAPPVAAQVGSPIEPAVPADVVQPPAPAHGTLSTYQDVRNSETPIRNNAAHQELPRGWWLTGSNPKGYNVEVERSGIDGEGARVHITSLREASEGFGAMMQSIRADLYRGKRVKVSASLMTTGTTGGAGIWFRVDGPDRKALAFRNTLEPEDVLSGENVWTERSVILDVPQNAVTLNYGPLLAGAGNVWVKPVQVEVVGTSALGAGQGVGASASESSLPNNLPTSPVNLDFQR